MPLEMWPTRHHEGLHKASRGETVMDSLINILQRFKAKLLNIL
jgi:hypothetical protein